MIIAVSSLREVATLHCQIAYELLDQGSSHLLRVRPKSCKILLIGFSIGTVRE